MTAPKLLVVGGGKMGSAMVAGMLDAGWATAGELAVADPDAGQRERLSERHPGLTVLEGPAEAEGALLAVKQDAVDQACRALGALGVPRVLSVVAGINTARLESVLPPGTVVVRAIPNTPSLVGAGVAAMSGGGTAIGADLDWAEGILSAVGQVVRLPERHLDAVTGLSGSGPAYVFLMAEAMIEAGVAAGLPRDISRDLVVGTLFGSAKLLVETGDDPAVLRAAVTSPGGTTAAGLRTLEFKAVRSAFIEAVAAATERSRQLGR
jgi:pyrroline-5-carboxylate reductase